jgi:DNA-directed RNA polymerase specialized sigma24 family protein
MENMINRLAHSFANTTGIEFKELQAEANLAYCEALLSYKEGKGAKVSTWVYTCVKNALTNFVAKEHKATFRGNKISLDSYAERVEKMDGLLDEYMPDALLSEDPEPWELMQQQFRGIARKVVDVVLELDHYSGTGKDMRGQVVKDLRAKGWGWVTIWNGVREVKSVLLEN